MNKKYTILILALLLLMLSGCCTTGTKYMIYNMDTDVQIDTCYRASGSSGNRLYTLCENYAEHSLANVRVKKM